MKIGYEPAVGEKFMDEGIEYECAPSTDHVKPENEKK